MPTLLAIIPHPDDESYSFGGTIALAVRAGWACFVQCASAGEEGKRHDGGETDRESVGATRRAELAESCRRLGAAPPACWDLPDGRLREAGDQSTRVVAAVRALHPDLLVALGADGAYGHPDHIVVYRWVRDAWRTLGADAPLLLWGAFPRGLFLPQYAKCLGMMGEPPSPAAEEIGSAPWDYEVPIGFVAETKRRAIEAHRSQLPGGDANALFPEGIVQQLMAMERFQDARGSGDRWTADALAALAGSVRAG